jgi:hypothetical protein
MKKDLPIYDIKLSDDTQGVGFISLVDEPAIGVDWIKLAKVTIKQEPKKVNSMMAKKALGTLDGSGCFGCPPNGDGTRVNGEPDGRCKGDSAGGGSGRGGSGRGGSKGGSVSIEKVTQSIDNRYEGNREARIAGYAGRVDSVGELEAGLNYITTGSNKTECDRLISDPKVVSDFVSKTESSLGDYSKTTDRLDKARSGNESYLNSKYGEGWMNKEVYKKDVVETGPFGGKNYIKDAPFIKNGESWVRVDSRDVSGSRSGGHDKYSKFQWTANEAKGTIYSHVANERYWDPVTNRRYGDN